MSPLFGASVKRELTVYDVKGGIGGGSGETESSKLS